MKVNVYLTRDSNEDTREMNLKRESKAYSYKDQLEELQLRRELEEKRRKEGKAKEVSLTAKQKEAIKAQLAKEDLVRQRLTAVRSRRFVRLQNEMVTDRKATASLSSS